jgi:hypothetical protein
MFGLCRVSVLLERSDLAIAEAPEMRELRIEQGIRRLVFSAISTSDHNGVAGVEKLRGDGLEIIPFGCEAKEDAFGNCAGPT